MTNPTYRLVSTEQVSWAPEPGVPGAFHKSLEEDPEILLRFIPPGWGLDDLGGKPMRHYHRTVAERSLQLHGDFPHWEYSGPKQVPGDMVIKRKGFFMDRPPRNVHGIETGPTSETGFISLYWCTGTGTGVNSPGDENVDIPFDGDLEAFGDDFTEVRYVQTQDMKWEPHPDVPGWKRKVLAPAEDREPVSLIFIPPDWQPSNVPLRGEPAPSRRWLYIVFGDLPIWYYAEPTSGIGEKLTLREGAYLAWPEGAALGWEKVARPEIGCVLLCVGRDFIP